MAAMDQKKLEALVTEGHFADIAPQLDTDELQVRHFARAGTSAPAHPLGSLVSLFL